MTTEMPRSTSSASIAVCTSDQHAQVSPVPKGGACTTALIACARSATVAKLALKATRSKLDDGLPRARSTTKCANAIPESTSVQSTSPNAGRGWRCRKRHWIVDECWGHRASIAWVNPNPQINSSDSTCASMQGTSPVKLVASLRRRISQFANTRTVAIKACLY